MLKISRVKFCENSVAMAKQNGMADMMHWKHYRQMSACDLGLNPVWPRLDFHKFDRFFDVPTIVFGSSSTKTGSNSSPIEWNLDFNAFVRKAFKDSSVMWRMTQRLLYPHRSHTHRPWRMYHNFVRVCVSVVWWDRCMQFPKLLYRYSIPTKTSN